MARERKSQPVPKTANPPTTEQPEAPPPEPVVTEAEADPFESLGAEVPVALEVDTAEPESTPAELSPEAEAMAQRAMAGFVVGIETMIFRRQWPEAPLTPAERDALEAAWLEVMRLGGPTLPPWVVAILGLGAAHVPVVLARLDPADPDPELDAAISDVVGAGADGAEAARRRAAQQAPGAEA